MPAPPRDWDFYISFHGDGLASVMVDLALADVAPLEERTVCVRVSIPLREPNDHGLSEPAERPELNAIEDALRDTLGAGAERLFVGRRIAAGRFELIFYRREDDESVERLVHTTMTRFPNYSADVTATPDPQWQVYRKELFPNQVELRQILNQRVLRRLEAHGDDLTQPRPVRHWLYFDNALNRADFVSAIDGRGFDTDETESFDADEPRPFGLRLQRADHVHHAAVNELTIDLMLLAEQYDGEYDGWETEVVRTE